MNEKIFEKGISEKQGNYLKPNYIISSMGCPPCKILGTILEVNEGRTSTNEPENKKAHDDA